MNIIMPNKDVVGEQAHWYVDVGMVAEHQNSEIMGHVSISGKVFKYLIVITNNGRTLKL